MKIPTASGEIEARMRELRLLISSESPLSNHDQLLDELSQLYTQTNFYPSDPMLYGWEVDKADNILVAAGGFGDCFKGLFLRRHWIAMKCSRSGVSEGVAMRRVEREMKVWKRLRHPNILPFLGSIALGSPPKLYMVSPWMPNGDLGHYLKVHPEADCTQLLIQIASGVEYLHDSKPVVVHGDLKAANVLISEEGEARLGDFGLSETLDQGNDIGNANTTNGNSSIFKFAGNPKWQAPELFDDEQRRTTQSDMFAFGRVMFEVYARETPFANLSPGQIISLVVLGKNLPRPQGEEVIARGLDDDMWKFMERCCNFDPQKRPSALEALRWLQFVFEYRKCPPTKPDIAAESIPLYRLYNPHSLDHFYTSDAAERDGAHSPGWHNEGTACRIMTSIKYGAIPLYRMWNGKDHFYTANLSEIESVAKNIPSYRLETHPGFVFPTQIEGTIALYRLFHPWGGDHFYTCDDAEKARCVTGGWKDEGDVGFVFPA